MLGYDNSSLDSGEVKRHDCILLKYIDRKIYSRDDARRSRLMIIETEIKCGFQI